MALFYHNHCFTDCRHSFVQRQEIGWRLFCSDFPQELPDVSDTCGLFNSDISIKFIPHQFTGIKVHIFHRPRHLLLNLQFLFPFTVPKAEFTFMLLVIILYEYKSLSHKSRFCCDRGILQYAVMGSLIHLPYIWCNCLILQLSKVPYTITEPVSCFRVGMIQWGGLSPTLQRAYIHLF